ncbi:SH3 domain-containing protein [Candidatus Falkowbacteria bacterium]|nr:SH3 domain-containing protein [Candidatus Falkowbacteria bacterium]
MPLLNQEQNKAHNSHALNLRQTERKKAQKEQKRRLACKDLQCYLGVHCSNAHPILKIFKKFWHCLKWAIKLLVPDFLIGHPNLWDNLKTLRKHPQFKPLRMALVAWLIFFLTTGSLWGIFIFRTYAAAGSGAFKNCESQGACTGGGTPSANDPDGNTTLSTERVWLRTTHNTNTVDPGFSYSGGGEGSGNSIEVWLSTSLATGHATWAPNVTVTVQYSTDNGGSWSNVTGFPQTVTPTWADALAQTSNRVQITATLPTSGDIDKYRFKAESTEMGSSDPISVTQDPAQSNLKFAVSPTTDSSNYNPTATINGVTTTVTVTGTLTYDWGATPADYGGTGETVTATVKDQNNATQQSPTGTINADGTFSIPFNLPNAAEFGQWTVLVDYSHNQDAVTQGNDTFLVNLAFSDVTYQVFQNDVSGGTKESNNTGTANMGVPIFITATPFNNPDNDSLTGVQIHWNVSSPPANQTFAACTTSCTKEITVPTGAGNAGAAEIEITGTEQNGSNPAATVSSSISGFSDRAITLSTAWKYSTVNTSIDNGITTDHDVYNLGETVNSNFYLYNVRDQLVKGEAAGSLTLEIIKASGGNDTSVAGETVDANGYVAWSYLTSSSHQYANDAVGSTKQLKTIDADGNTVTSGNEWALSSLLTVDNIWHSKLTSDPSEATQFFIGADNMQVKTHVLNVRNENKSGADVAHEVRDPDNNLNTSWTNATGADGWTAFQKVVPEAPAGAWSLKATASDASGNSSATATESISYVSAYTAKYGIRTVGWNQEYHKGDTATFTIQLLEKDSNDDWSAVNPDTGTTPYYEIQYWTGSAWSSVVGRTNMDEKIASSTWEKSYAIPNSDTVIGRKYSITFNAKLGGAQIAQLKEFAVVQLRAGDPMTVAASPVRAAPNDTVKVTIREANLDATVLTGNAANTFIYIYDSNNTLQVNGANPTELANGAYYYDYTLGASPMSGVWQAVVKVTIGGSDYAAATNFQIDYQLAKETTAQEIKTKTDTIDWTDVTTIKNNVATLISEIGTGNISAIKTKTDTIAWGDITGLVTTSGQIKAKTDTIAWTDVSAIKTKTDTIVWSDVTGIDTKVTSLQSDMATLISEIGTGNISAIKTKTDTINWANVTSILTDTGAIKTKTDTIAWTDIAAIKTQTDTIVWGDVTGIKLKTDTIVWGDITDIKTNVAALITEVGTGNISAIKTKTDTINWANVTSILTDTGAIKLKTDTIDWTHVTAIKTKTDTISWDDVTGIKLKTDTINWSDVTTIKNNVDTINTNVNTINANVDILIGAFIVTQSTVNDASPSVTSFITSLTNSTDDFYKNSVLTFTSGALNGQVRRISAYNGTTKSITLDPALTSAPANGDAFTIAKQNVRVEEQVSNVQSDVTTIKSDTAYIRTKADSIYSLLQTVDTNLSSVETIVTALRTSQQTAYSAKLSNVSEIQAGNTYRAKLTLLDFESEPVDAASTPTITIYDSTRAVAVASTTMTKLSPGVYEYTYALSSSATTGLWEAIVNAAAGSSGTQTLNDYFQVTGSPAQVVINSMSDLTVPSIAADTTITNEGGGAFEYQYEWCVVSSEENPCGGADDVYYASAAKLIQAGDSFNTQLTATVPNTGDYWFKVVVYFGTQASGASRTFTATTETAVPSGGGGPPAPSVTPAPEEISHNTIYSEVVKVKKMLELESIRIGRMLDTLGIINPDIKQLLIMNEAQLTDLKSVQNKLADIKAVSSVTRRIVEEGAVQPVIETYMTFNSVEIHFLITNPANTEQTIKFKSFLPEEVRPEHILDSNGLKVDFDAGASVYFVSGDIALGPKQTVTRKVELKDIWVFPEEEIISLGRQSTDLAAALRDTQYDAQGTILKNDIDSALEIVLQKQKDGYASPQDHIVAFRENKLRMEKVEKNLEKLKDLVVQAGASQGLVGKVGGIQTFATWGIVLAIVFGFGLLAAVIFAMWRHQMALAAITMGMSRREVMEKFGGFGARQRTRKITKVKKVSPLMRRATRRLPWKKILIGLVTVGLLSGLPLLAIKFLPSLLGDEKLKPENQESSSLLPEDSATPETASFSAIPEMQTSNINYDLKFKDEEFTPANPKLKISDTLTNWINVRDRASREGKIVARAYPGKEYEYINKNGGWYEIKLSDDKTGWILGQYAKPIQ